MRGTFSGMAMPRRNDDNMCAYVYSDLVFRGTLATMKEQIAKEEEVLSNSKKLVEEFNDMIAAIEERRKVAEVSSEGAICLFWNIIKAF